MGDDPPYVLSSKVRRPTIRAGILPRGDLTGRMNAGFDPGGQVGLVCAPAGAGKTTLIASYLDEYPPSNVAWFHADPGDNDPARFWAYLIGAVAPDRAPPAALLRSGNWSSVAAGAAATFEEMGQTALVIDDYHHITAPVVHDHLELLLQWLPPSGRVIISTRVDPPLPCLARFRLHGQLVELRASDLAFDAEQGLELLTAATSVAIDSTDAAKLVERTEGWAAGLYLAALSIERHHDASTVVAHFDGDDRLMADYLRAEFLDGLDGETERFLLNASVLDELSGPLCAAVTGVADAADRLRNLERQNLLIVPLDNTGQWYRLHHLLSYWLRAELAHRHPEVVKELNRRAAIWYHEQGRGEAGIAHALAAGDPEVAADLIDAVWHDALLAGQVFTVRDWFDSLDPDVVARRAGMAAARARICLNTGRPPEEVEAWLDLAEQAGPDVDDRVEIDRVRAVHRRQIGDLIGAEESARSAVAAARTQTIEDHTLLGSILHLAGKLDDAREELLAAVNASRGTADALDFQLADGHLAAVAYELGHRREARARAVETLDGADRAGLSSWPTNVVANYVLAVLALDDNDLEAAESFVNTALDQAVRARYRPMEYLTLMAQARLRVAGRHRAEGRRVAEQARRLLAAMPAADGLQDRAASAGRPVDQIERPAVDTAMVEDLTDRELAVLRLLASKLSLRDVGSELYVSHNTVKGHAKSIYRKLGVHSRASAVARARELDLL